MGRIFISYAKADPAPTLQLARRVEMLGHDVWFDSQLVAGENYRDVIDRQIDSANLVIVVWTEASIKSKWVIAEAEHADRLGKLMTVSVSGLQAHLIPKPFNILHTILLDDDVALREALRKKLLPSSEIPQRILDVARPNFIAVAGLAFGIATAASMLIAALLLNFNVFMNTFWQLPVSLIVALAAGLVLVALGERRISRVLSLVSMVAFSNIAGFALREYVLARPALLPADLGIADALAGVLSNLIAFAGLSVLYPPVGKVKYLMLVTLITVAFGFIGGFLWADMNQEWSLYWAIGLVPVFVAYACIYVWEMSKSPRT
jgi:hypothetical protein